MATAAAMVDARLVDSNPGEYGPEVMVARCAQVTAAVVGEALEA